MQWERSIINIKYIKSQIILDYINLFSYNYILA